MAVMFYYKGLSVKMLEGLRGRSTDAQNQNRITIYICIHDKLLRDTDWMLFNLN